MADQVRLPLSAVYERDVDLILAEEFPCSSEFVQWFWSLVPGNHPHPSVRSLDEVAVRQRDLSGDGEGRAKPTWPSTCR